MAKNQTLRSVGAVLAGFFAVALITTGIDIALHSAGVFPPMGERMSDPLFGLAAAYRVVLGILGGYITARLAPNKPMKHALILGTVGLVLSTAGAIAMWHAGPPWYSLLIIAIAVPTAWAGAKMIKENRR